MPSTVLHPTDAALRCREQTCPSVSHNGYDNLRSAEPLKSFRRSLTKLNLGTAAMPSTVLHPTDAALLTQGANLSFKSHNGYDNLKTAEPLKSFKRSPTKLGSSPARPSQDGEHSSVVTKMKRSITMLGGRAGSESGMTDRSTKVSVACDSMLMSFMQHRCSAGMVSYMVAFTAVAALDKILTFRGTPSRKTPNNLQPYFMFALRFCTYSSRYQVITPAPVTSMKH